MKGNKRVYVVLGNAYGTFAIVTRVLQKAEAGVGHSL